ncbi:MAG: hypothetical protein ACM3PZ_02135 [Bacillota bacterium]
MNYKKTNKTIEFAATDKEALEIEKAANSFLESNKEKICVNKVRMATIGYPIASSKEDYSFTVSLEYDKGAKQGTLMRISLFVCLYEEMKDSLWRLGERLKGRGRNLTDYKYRLFVDHRSDGEVKCVVMAFHIPAQNAAS